MTDILITIASFCLIFLIALLIVMFCHESQIAHLESKVRILDSGYRRLLKQYKKLFHTCNGIIDTDIEFVEAVFARLDELEEKYGKK